METLTIVVSVVAIVVSIISLIISTAVAVKSWHKNRVVYDLEEKVLRKIDGSRNDSSRGGLEEIKKELNTGRYNIEAVLERKDGDWAVLLARVKK